MSLGRIPARWVVMFVFTLASSLSFLDRQMLAALAPELRREFRLSHAEYGYVLSAFSIAYALTSPLAGLLIDRIGLNRGISLSVGLWSMAGITTGLVNGFGWLLGCRAALGAAESGGIPASGKAIALYLKPQERALGSAFGQIGISIGLVAAPVFAGGLAARYGWRSAFVAAGVLGFFWIPLWLWTTSRIPQREAARAPSRSEVAGLIRDRRLWALLAANVLSMTVYSLWMNWTTVFLVEAKGLSQQEANLRLAWVPPVFAALGGLTGGWISLRLARAGVDLVAVRGRTVWLCAMALLLTAAAPHMPTAGLATAAICWSFFWTVALSVNIYALPLDYFGASRAAFGVSALTFAYGLMQTFLSPLVGVGIDKYGFGLVCAVVAVLPLAAAASLKLGGLRL